MASQSQFPKVVPTLRTTRQHICHSDFDDAIKWTAELDWSDFVNLWVQKRTMPIFYVLINTFLLILRYDTDHDKCFFNDYISKILEHGSKYGFTRKLVIQELITQIATLYNKLDSFPSAIRIPNPITDAIVLYHGSNSIRYKTMIDNLNILTIGTIFELPIFMSTSPNIDVACRFGYGSKIILAIVVYAKDMSTFKYTFLGDTLDLQTKKPEAENEMLLNLYTKLKLTRIRHGQHINYSVPLLDGSTETKVGVFTIIDMEFLNHSQYTQESIIQNLKRFHDSSSGKYKKKLRTKQLSNKAKLKQSKRLLTLKKLYKKKYYTRKNPKHLRVQK
jgi:hypothetical protein